MNETAVKREIATVEAQPLAPVVPISESTALVAMIERAARDPAVDIDKMERLLLMQERVMSRQAEREYNEAMCAAQADMPAVIRDAENKHSGSKYSRLETIGKATDPIITKHGFALEFGSDKPQAEGCYGVTCHVRHKGGHSVNHRGDIPIDAAGMKGTTNKNVTQAFGSTMTYGRRYLTLLIFNIKLKNEDDDGNAAGQGETISDEQVDQISKLLTETKSNLVLFLKTIKLESLTEIRASKFNDAVALIRNTAAKRAAREKESGQ